MDAATALKGIADTHRRSPTWARLVLYYAHVLALVEAHQPLLTAQDTPWHTDPDGTPVLADHATFTAAITPLAAVAATLSGHDDTRILTAARHETRAALADRHQPAKPPAPLPDSTIARFYTQPGARRLIEPPTAPEHQVRMFTAAARHVTNIATRLGATPSQDTYLELIGQHHDLLAATVWRRHRRNHDTLFTLEAWNGWPVDTWNASGPDRIRVITWTDDDVNPHVISSVHLPAAHHWETWTLLPDQELMNRLLTFDALLRDGMNEHDAARSAAALDA